ncbi:MAG: glycosyltransferase [Planctomycetia bacterium]|nr:glycosyltransferase [Planctomycetia bacterium]
MTRRRLVHVVESLEPWSAQRMLSLVARRLPVDMFEQRVVALHSAGESEDLCRAELLAAGIQVDVVGGLRARSQNSERRSCGDSRVAATWGVRRFVARDAAEIVHLWDDSARACVGPWIALTNGPAIVYSLRNPRCDALGLDRFLERRTLSRAAAIIANDPTVRTQRLAVHPRYQSQWAGKTRVVRDSIEPAKTYRNDGIRSALGVPQSTKLIGTACRLVPDANVRDLLFAGALLKLVHEDFRIVICGDGPSRDDLRRFATLMRIDEITHFVGPAIDPDAVISELFAYVAPAYWAGPAREIGVALRHGVPVVGVDTPVRRAELDVERNGFVFREHDQGALTRHLHQLLGDAPVYDRMSSAARERAQGFSHPDEVAAQYAAIYDEVAR